MSYPVASEAPSDVMLHPFVQKWQEELAEVDERIMVLNTKICRMMTSWKRSIAHGRSPSSLVMVRYNTLLADRTDARADRRELNSAIKQIQIRALTGDSV